MVWYADNKIVFEDEELNVKATIAVEKTIHHSGEVNVGEPGVELEHVHDGAHLEKA